MYNESRLFDINDKVNSLRYCLDNELESYEIINKSTVLDKLDLLSEGLLKETGKLSKRLPILSKSIENESFKKIGGRVEVGIKKSLTSFMSTVYKIELLKSDIKQIEDGDLRVSSHVKNYFYNV